jgi:Ca2+-binding EF-hand superfamily protein
VLTAEEFAAMDMDGDGLLTMADVVLVMRRAAGLY